MTSEIVFQTQVMSTFFYKNERITTFFKGSRFIGGNLAQSPEKLKFPLEFLF